MSKKAKKPKEKANPPSVVLNSQTSSWRRFLPLILGVLFTGTGIIGILYLLSPTVLLQTYFAALDIRHDCPEPLEGFVAFTPRSNSPDVDVTIAIDNWKNVKDKCSILQIHFPGMTFHHNYLISAGKMPSDGTLSSNKVSRKNTRRTLDGKMELKRDDFFPQDIFRIYTAKLDGFVGAIEFVWLNGFVKSSFSTRTIYMPVQAPQLPDETLNYVKKYRIQILPKLPYRLVNSVPNLTRYQLMGNRSLYEFAFEVSESDLVVTFEDEVKSRYRDYLIVILSIVLGIGLSIMSEEFLRLIRKGK